MKDVIMAWQARDLIIDFLKSKKGKTITDRMLTSFRKLINDELRDNFKATDNEEIDCINIATAKAYKQAFMWLKMGFAHWENGGHTRLSAIERYAYTSGGYFVWVGTDKQSITAGDFKVLQLIFSDEMPNMYLG